MSIVIGIDSGISATKIIGIEDGKRIKPPLSVACNDAISSIYGALGNYLHAGGIPLADVKHIMVTGVGASKLKSPLHDIPTSTIDEFLANGRGARFDTGLDHMIVVSMGTGTSLVRVDGDDITHLGGIGMGGGTLLGLSQLLLRTHNMEEITALAEFGYSGAVNLRVEDICDTPIAGLTEDATVSLFARAITRKPTNSDIAAGIIHMILETIGSAAVLSQINNGFKDFVLIGKLTELEACKSVFPKLEELYQVRFHIPKYASYCTALGAALSYGYENDNYPS